MKSKSYPNKVPDNELEQVVVMSIPEKGKVNRIWSPTMFPPLKITSNNVTRKIAVELVSTETEDKRLLHKLLTEARAI